MYSFLLVLIYIAFISLGLPDSLLGAGWPVMHAELGVRRFIRASYTPRPAILAPKIRAQS